MAKQYNNNRLTDDPNLLKETIKEFAVQVDNMQLRWEFKMQQTQLKLAKEVKLRSLDLIHVIDKLNEMMAVGLKKEIERFNGNPEFEKIVAQFSHELTDLVNWSKIERVKLEQEFNDIEDDIKMSRTIEIPPMSPMPKIPDFCSIYDSILKHIPSYILKDFTYLRMLEQQGVYNMFACFNAMLNVQSINSPSGARGGVEAFTSNRPAIGMSPAAMQPVITQIESPHINSTTIYHHFNSTNNNNKDDDIGKENLNIKMNNLDLSSTPINNFQYAQHMTPSPPHRPQQQQQQQQQSQQPQQLQQPQQFRKPTEQPRVSEMAMSEIKRMIDDPVKKQGQLQLQPPNKYVGIQPIGPVNAEDIPLTDNKPPSPTYSTLSQRYGRSQANLIKKLREKYSSSVIPDDVLFEIIERSKEELKSQGKKGFTGMKMSDIAKYICDFIERKRLYKV